MPKKILVTGAAGFIGFHTALALKKRGDEVFGLDNFNDYYSPDLKEQRAKLLAEAGIEVVKGDVNDPELLSTLFERGPTHVLHLAAQAGVRHARKYPEAYLKSNIDGFLAILEQLKTRPEIPLIYASSSSVYGTNEKVPFSVDDRTDSPANLYAATKKTNELLAYSYHHIYGIKTTGLRYFTVYGPWGRPDMAYYLFTKSILEERSIHLFNHGKMWRDFTYIDDIVAGTIAALDLSAPYELFNLGNHRSEKLLDFVKILEELLEKKATLILEGPRVDEVERTYADIEKSRQLLNYRPTTKLKEGLAQFVDWYCAKTKGKASVMSDATMQ